MELSNNSIAFKREFQMPIMYKGKQIGERRRDFLVFEKTSVELKAIIKLEPIHFAQGINYIVAYNLEIGLLINFGSASLEVKRLLNKNVDFRIQYFQFNSEIS